MFRKVLGLLLAGLMICAPRTGFAAAYRPLVNIAGVTKQIPNANTVATPASTTANASLNLPQGTAPTSPVNGDVWTTSAGIYVRIAGSTVGPLSAGGLPGGSSGQIQYNNAGSFGGFTLGGDCTFSVPNVTCTKTGGVSFATSATTDTTNAANISSGVLGASRGGAGSVSGILKANGSGVVSAATSGTDYAPATSGTALLYGNGSGGFSNVTIGSGLGFSAGTLSASASGTVTTTGSPASGNLAKFSGSASITNTTVGAFLDSEFGSTQGSVLYRGASAWTALTPGSAGQILQTNGAAANPSWAWPTGVSTGADYFTAPGVTKTVPAAASFTTDASTNASASVAYSADRAVLTVGSSSFGAQTGFAYVNYPGTNFTMTALVMLQAHIWNNHTQYWGLAIRDTSPGKIYMPAFSDFASGVNGGGASELIVSTYATINGTTPANVAVSWWQGWPFSGVPVWMRLQQSGGNFITSVSQDGSNWVVLDSRAASIIGTPAHIGIFYTNTTASQPAAFVSIFSLSITTP